jgi:hypothetical protein
MRLLPETLLVILFQARNTHARRIEPVAPSLFGFKGAQAVRVSAKD